MGIQGLHKELKSITRRCNISEYRGKKVAIDAYVWLHKGTYCCAAELCQNIATDKYLGKGKHLIGMLKHHKVIPVVIFDGAYLPSKAGTEHERREKRVETLETARELLKLGNSVEANNYFKKAVDVTPFMAYKFIQWLHEQKVECFVAPYEADAQLAYLARTGYVDCVITEDSDLVAFQTPKMFFKMDDYGEGDEIVLNNLASNVGLNFQEFTHDMVIRWCIVSGCDYLPSLPKIGIKKAHKVVKDNRVPSKILSALRSETPNGFPEEYEQLFEQAELTFKYQRVFDPISETVITLTPLPDDIDPNSINFCGPPIEPSLAKKICLGQVDPITHEPFEKKANGLKLGGQTKLVTNFFTKSKPVVKPPPKIVASSAALKPFKPPRLSQDSPTPEEEKPKKTIVVSKYFKTTTTVATVETVNSQTESEPKSQEEKVIYSNASTTSVISTTSVVNNMNNLDIEPHDAKDIRKRSQSLSQEFGKIQTPTAKKSLSQDAVGSPYFSSPLVNDAVPRMSYSARKATSATRASIFDKYQSKKRGNDDQVAAPAKKIDYSNSQALSSDDDLSSQNSCFEDSYDEDEPPQKKARTSLIVEEESKEAVVIEEQSNKNAFKPNTSIDDAILIESDDEEEAPQPTKRKSMNLFERFLEAKKRKS